MNKLNNKAFTLIELIVVIAILGVLVLLAAPKFLGYTNDAKLAQIKNDVRAYENAIENERINDDDFISGWEVIHSDELNSLIEGNEVYNKKGLVPKEDLNLQSGGVLYKIERNKVNVKSKLKGNFILAQDREIYYISDKSKSSGEAELKTTTFDFNEAVGANQEHIFIIDNLKDVKDLKVDNGIVEIVSINGNEVKIRVDNGDMTRKEQTGGELTPASIEYVEFITTGLSERTRIRDNSYEINLHTYPTSSSFIEGYNSKYNGYSGNFDREYIGSDYKKVKMTKLSCFGRDTKNYIYDNNEWIYKNGTTACANTISNKIEPYYKDNDEYDMFYNIPVDQFKNIPFGDLHDGDYELKELAQPIVWDGREDIINPKQGDEAEVLTFYYSENVTGLVFQGGMMSAKWKYSGEVTIPEQDTRTYDEYYKYSVTIEYE